MSRDDETGPDEEGTASGHDPEQYREGRDSRPAEGPGQTTEEAEASLPPGSDTATSNGPRGDVDRSEPYESSDAPRRMGEEQPPPAS